VQKGTSCLGQRTDDEGNQFGNVGSAERGVPSWFVPLPSSLMEDNNEQDARHIMGAIVLAVLFWIWLGYEDFSQGAALGGASELGSIVGAILEMVILFTLFNIIVKNIKVSKDKTYSEEEHIRSILKIGICIFILLTLSFLIKDCLLINCKQYYEIDSESLRNMIEQRLNTTLIR